MGTIYLVRHGQASFGTEDYDRLTATGFEQSRLLGAYFAARGIRFEALFTGTLRRHLETARAILESHAQHAADAGAGLAPAQCPELNEYDPEALVEAFTGAPLPREAPERARDPAVVRDHFRLLRGALLAWAEGRTAPAGMPTWAAFQAGAVEALAAARSRHGEGNVLIVSSGGPIAATVAAALDAPAASAIELNLRVRNTGVTEFATTVKRHHLVVFNGLGHLEAHANAGLRTYA